LKRLEPVVRKHHGLVDRLFGDRVLCLYPRSADDAVAASLEILGGGTPIGIGIASGPLVFGTAGSEEHLAGAIVADVVPAAARLVSEAVSSGAALLVAESTAKALSAEAHAQFELSLHRALSIEDEARSVVAYRAATKI
jgi:two-component system sensor histidine kinase ChiS